jgi:FixJ family two-component response regulator
MTDQPKCYVIGVVDDDRRLLEALEILLESADFAVRSFASAKALLDSGCLAIVDCLISDIDMPVMDGIELLQVVRAERSGLPVVLITGLPDIPDRIPAVGTGDYILFRKPFDGQALLTAISDALQDPPSMHIPFVRV